MKSSPKFEFAIPDFHLLSLVIVHATCIPAYVIDVFPIRTWLFAVPVGTSALYPNIILFESVVNPSPARKPKAVLLFPVAEESEELPKLELPLPVELFKEEYPNAEFELPIMLFCMEECPNAVL